MDDIFRLQLPYYQIVHVVIVGVRIGAMLLFSPIWGSPSIPVQVRLFLVFVTAAGISTIIPFNQAAYEHPEMVLGTEFFIGLLLGMGVRIAFAVLQFAGHMIGFSVGFSAVTAIDPLTSNRSTLMAGFLTMMGYVLFLGTDQHHEFIRAMRASYDSLPIGTMPTVGSWFENLMAAGGSIFVFGWKISFPLFLVVLISDTAVGFLSRMQPQFNTIVLAMPIKVLIGLVALSASIVTFPSIMRQLSDFVILR